MKFGWINVFSAGIVIALLIPNIIYALKNKGEKNLCKNRMMNIIEQIGRYGCIIFMWLPLFVREFGFGSVAQMLFFTLTNIALLCAYLIIFALHLKKKSPKKAMALAILPSCIFLISAIILRHWLLLGFALLFTVGHIYVSAKNIKK